MDNNLYMIIINIIKLFIKYNMKTIIFIINNNN